MEKFGSGAAMMVGVVLRNQAGGSVWIFDTHIQVPLHVRAFGELNLERAGRCGRQFVHSLSPSPKCAGLVDNDLRRCRERWSGTRPPAVV